MIWYFLAISLHIVAVTLWIGQAIYRTMIAEPIIKGLGSQETLSLWEINDKLDRLGWPCLLISAITGIFILYYQGTTIREVSSGHLSLGQYGQLLQVKLLLVGVMIVLQLFVRPSRVALRWCLLCVGLMVIGLSTVLVRW